MKIRKGDTVRVLAGKDKGVKGKVITTSRGARSGGLVHEEAPVHVSNVQLVDPESGKGSRIGSRREVAHKSRPDGSTYEAERNVRVARRSGKDV